MNHPKYKYQKQSFNEEAKISNHFPSLKDQIFSPGDDDINQKTIQKNSLNNFKILDDDDDIIFNKLNFKYMLKRNPFSLCEQETKLKINTNLLEERKTKKKYQREDNRIKIIKNKKNYGCAYSRANGIKLIKGKYR